jgi:hypothetical protein
MSNHTPYWLGVVSTLAFMQADHDVEANKHLKPTITVRLPYIENAEPEDLERFGAAVDYLNEDCKILYWRLVNTDSYGEHTIELGSTEGYQGLPMDELLNHYIGEPNA